MKRKLYKISCLMLSALLPMLMVAEFIGVQIQKKNFKQQLILNSPILYKFQETLFVSNDDYTNQHVGDEIELNGYRYDILSVSKEKDGYYLKVFNDVMEQKFESLLTQQSSENHPSKNSKKNSIQNIQLFVVSNLDFQYPATESIKTFRFSNSRLLKGFMSNPFLPPEFC